MRLPYQAGLAAGMLAAWITEDLARLARCDEARSLNAAAEPTAARHHHGASIMYCATPFPLCVHVSYVLHYLVALRSAFHHLAVDETGIVLTLSPHHY